MILWPSPHAMPASLAERLNNEMRHKSATKNSGIGQTANCPSRLTSDVITFIIVNNERTATFRPLFCLTREALSVSALLAALLSETALPRAVIAGLAARLRSSMIGTGRAPDST